MSRDAGKLLTTAIWLALAGCGQDTAPAPESTASAVPSRPDASAAPSDIPEAQPSEIASSAAPAALSGKSYAPRDDCSAAPGWPAFRQSLAAAVRDKDADAMAALAAPDITLDYGGGSGTDELKKRLADPERQLWRELSGILPLGCAVEGGLAAMPWVFWNVPDNIDSYSAMLVTGDDADLLDSPNGQAQGNVGWFIVGIDPLAFKPGAKLTRVTLDNGEKGWVETARLRSLLDYRLIAEPKDGSWKITAFIAGD
jgi:hypothetical protein